MKYIIFTLLVLVVVGFVYKDELNQYFEEKHIFQFKDKDSDQNTANNNKYKSLTGDDKLVQAIINSDGEAVEAILSSTENGEFIRMLKSLKPEKIYSIMDVARSTCKPGPACSKKVPPDDDVIQNCAETMMSIKDNEIKKTPSCKKDIDEFYATLFLCQLYQNQTVCVADDPQESPKDRGNRLIARGQNSVDCMMRHLDNLNAKNTCIMNTPKYTQSQLDILLKKYCQEAISCKAFTNESDCVDKYKQLFKDDNQKGKDCTNSHLTALAQEFELLNFLLEKKFGFDAFQNPYDNCMLINNYEQMIHIEEIFEKAKNIQDYSNRLSNELQKYGHECRLTWNRIPIYFPSRNSDYNKMLTDYSVNYNYYSACRIGHLSPK